MARKIIIGLSGLGIIAGGVMIIFAFLMTDSDILKQLEEDPELSDIEDGRKLVFLILLLFALSAIGVSACGCFLWCCKNRCFICMYAILLLPTWIIVLSFGAVSLFVATASQDLIDDTCEDFATQNSYTVESTDYDLKVSISLDIYDSIYINQYMCSNVCPCEAVAQAGEWEGMSVAKVESDYKRDVISRPFDFTGTYTNYEQCIDGVDEETTGETDPAFYAFANSLRSQGDFQTIKDWIKFFEEDYSCSGICKAALFSWQNSIAAGRPTQSCISSIKDDLGDAFKGLAIAAILSGLLLFFTFICQYCLWRKYDD